MEMKGRDMALVNRGDLQNESARMASRYVARCSYSSASKVHIPERCAKVSSQPFDWKLMQETRESREA